MKGKDMGVTARKASLKRLLPRDQNEERKMLQVERTASTKVLRWKGLGVFEKVTRRHSADAW